jgi:NADPH:quinone reductase-like Zn-dependent oxidoreductase
MKAIIVNEFGPSAELIYTEVPIPTITENEVLVKVSAISINPVDVKTFEGSGSAKKILERPVILGWDIAGTVTESQSALFEVGDEVFGMIRFPESGKAYAEYVSAPADQLALKPSNVTFEEAAATTLAALTAWQNLTEHYKVEKGQKVLIHAGAGGVGHFAIQIAKYFEAYVYTTASAENIDFVKSLGADESIDHNAVAFEENLREIDFVLNSLSDETSEKSLKVLKPGGTLISIASEVSEEVLVRWWQPTGNT